jgi:hypothetical protein
MSLRIRSGFQVRTYHGVGPDFFDFYNRLQDLRPLVQRIGRAAILQYLAKTAVLKFDYWTYFEAERPRTPRAPLPDAIHLYESRTREILTRPMQEILYPEIDYACELSLFPLPDGRMLGLLSAANPEVRKVIEGQEWYEPYDYDAALSTTDGVPEHEWSSRGRDWAKVFSSPNANPDLSGIRVMLAPLQPHWPEATPAWPYPSAERILSHAPNYDYRMRLITETSLWQSWVQAQDVQPPDALSQAIEFRKWMATESGQMSLKLQVEIVRKKLPKDVTISDLFSQFVVSEEIA